MADANETAVETALREAHEEVGLSPDFVEVLGALDDFPTLFDGVVVSPVVGRVVHLPPLVPETSEVARIFTVPLSVLAERDSWRVTEVERNGQTLPMFFCDYDGETLWGLSAYMTLHLLELFWPTGSPFDCIAGVEALRVNR
jgi:hypothetical protein